MQRVRTEITAIESSEPRDHPAGAVTVRAKVKVIGPAVKAYRLPDGTRGRETVVERVVHRAGWLAVGEPLLLSTTETAALLAPDAPAAVVPAAGRTSRLEGDFNRDGFAEQRLVNDLVAVTIDPSFGARVTSLSPRRTGCELLPRPAATDPDDPLREGFSDGLSGADPNPLSAAEYRLAEVADDEIVVARELKGPIKGDLIRRMLLADDSPMLEMTVTVRRWHDDDEAKKEKERAEQHAKGEFDDEHDGDPPRDPLVTYQPVLTLAAGEPTETSAELLLPTADGLRRWSWDHAQWADLRPGPAACLALRRPGDGAAMVLWQPGSIETIALRGHLEPGLIRLDLHGPATPLKLGQSFTRGLALLAADDVAACGAGLAAVTVDGRGTVVLTVRGEPTRAVVRAGDELAEPTFERVRHRRLGGWYRAVVGELPAGAGLAEVWCGDERMVLRWNA